MKHTVGFPASAIPSWLATPARGTEAFFFQRVFWVFCLRDAGAGGSAGSQQQGPMWGGRDMACLQPRSSSCCGQEGCNSPGAEPVPLSTWGAPAMIYDKRSAASKVYSSRKINSLGGGKSLGLWKALTLQIRGHQEAKSRERYKSFHPSEFSLSDLCASVYRNTGRQRKSIRSTSLLDEVTSS